MRYDDVIREVREIVAEVMAAHPDDEDLLHDMLEGETEFIELIDWLARQEGELGAMGDVLKQRAVEISARRKRLEEGRKRIRGRIADLIRQSNLKTVRTPEATITLRAARPALVIDNEAEIPEHLTKVVRQPDKTAIRAALERGENVPGAHLEPVDHSLTIRRG